MAVTIAVTPEPANVPPRMRLDLDTGNASNSFAAIEVRRDGEVLRSQPPAGSNLSVAYDYDAPFGTPVTYEAAGSYYNNAASPEWTESWASYAAWTGDTASYSTVSSHAQTTLSSQRMTRMTVADIAKVTVGGTPAYVTVQFLDAGGAEQARLSWVNNYGAVKLWSGSTNISALGGGPATISIYGGFITATGSTWSLSLPFTGTIQGIGVLSLNYVASSGVTAKVGAISVTPPQTLVDFVSTDSDTLAVAGAWLMHPVDPDRSLPIHDEVGTTGIYVTAESGEQIDYGERRELFAPLGRRRLVPVSYGQRRVGDWSLVLNCATIEDRDAVLALLVDQAPLLLRTPATGWDLPDDWYSVGAVADQRKVHLSNRIIRVLTLPLTPVDEPVLTQGAEWTWSDVLAGYASYSSVLNNFDTHLDLLTGPAA